jgi:hypothetical protein
MSSGTKKEASPTRSKRKPKPPKGHEAWFGEYERLVRLAARAESRGQVDTYWHKRKAELETAFATYDLEVPNG